MGDDLSVRGMIRNRHLDRSIADAGWCELAPAGVQDPMARVPARDHAAFLSLQE